MKSPVQPNKDHLKRNLKACGYLLFLLPVAMPYIGYWLSLKFGAADLFAFSTVAFFYLMIPMSDFLVGKDPVNPDEKEVSTLSNQAYYRWLPQLGVPIAVASLCAGAWMLTHWNALSWIGKLGLIFSYGTIHAGVMINLGHELIHKTTKLEQRAGGFLLSLVCYPSFKIEHVRGHHVNVATPLDKSTSQYGQSLYHFLSGAIYHNVKAAWQLETQFLIKRGKNPWSWNNELIRWYVVVLLAAAVMTLTFGMIGLVYFLVQSLIAIGLLETVNYLEHYGLTRRKLANGRYERTTHEHSWNSNYLLSNLFTLQLQRHSDHHANPQRRYNVLRHFDDSPQLPAGYSLMILVAMVPPLWMKIMNPRVDAYYAER